MKAKAATLAGKIKVSYQHALGSLIEFWDINGEPRALERLVEQGITELVLTREDVIRRFSLASGVDVDPALLADLGLLEQRKAQFRVRGMSRFFAPITKRLKNRESASTGGKVSAGVRRERYGSAQPPTPPDRLPIASGSAQAVVEASASGSAQAIARAESNPSDQRSAINDQRQTNRSPPADLFPETVPPKAPREQSDHEVFFEDYSALRRKRLEELNLDPVDEPVHPGTINAVGVRWLRWFRAADPDPGPELALELQIDMVQAFLAADWPAKKDPPYPFAMLASEKVWKPLAEKIVADRMAQ